MSSLGLWERHFKGVFCEWVPVLSRRKFLVALHQLGSLQAVQRASCRN